MGRHNNEAMTSPEQTKSHSEIVDLLKKHRVAMLTTMDGEKMVSRPMGMQAPEQDATLWFFCHRTSDVADQVRADPRVVVALSDDDYLSVTGTAEVVFDPEKNRELWGPFVEAFMQCEPDDPEASLIKVSPQTIAYWDSPNAAAKLFGMVKAMVTGSDPDVGESGVVNVD